MTEAEPALPPGVRLLRYDTIGSTNEEAKRLAREGAPEGTWVWGLEQTAGRGRRGRFWASPPGNLYVSLVLRPACSAAQAAQLGFVAALALGEALARMLPAGAELRYKWPNDVLIGGRKIAGILLESEMGPGERLSFVVLGAGVNLASSPPEAEFPATSLAEEGVSGVAPGRLLGAFATAFVGWAQRWRNEGFAPLRGAWLARAVAVGAAVRVRLDHAAFEGRFLDLDEDGALMLDTPQGRRRITAGDVFPAA